MNNNIRYLLRLVPTLKILSFQEWGVPVQVRPRAPNLISDTLSKYIFTRPSKGLADCYFYTIVLLLVDFCIKMKRSGMTQKASKSLRVSTLCQQTLKHVFTSEKLYSIYRYRQVPGHNYSLYQSIWARS